MGSGVALRDWRAGGRTGGSVRRGTRTHVGTIFAASGARLRAPAAYKAPRRWPDEEHLCRPRPASSPPPPPALLPAVHTRAPLPTLGLGVRTRASPEARARRRKSALPPGARGGAWGGGAGLSKSLAQ